MPRLDGYAATAEWRRSAPDPRHRTHTDRWVTASALAGDRERCLAAGMDDYLSKPFRREDLRALVERWLPLRPPSAPSWRSTKVRRPGSAEPARRRRAGSDGKTIENLRCLTPAGPALLGISSGSIASTFQGSSASSTQPSRATMSRPSAASSTRSIDEREHRGASPRRALSRGKRNDSRKRVGSARIRHRHNREGARARRSRDERLLQEAIQ